MKKYFLVIIGQMKAPFFQRICLAALVTMSFMSCSPNEQSQDKSISPVDFDVSMGEGTELYDRMMNKNENNVRYTIAKQAFIANLSHPLPVKQQGYIPKILHQIWLGPKQPPLFFEEYKKSWIKYHPDWEYHLWTDAEVASLNFELKDLYERSVNWGEKSDILRAELLDRFGGVYMDVDFKCLKSFDYLNEHYSFFAGIEPPHENIGPDSTPEFVISDALIGACPGHNIIKAWKANIRNSWDAIERKYPECQERVLFRTFFPFGSAVIRQLEENYTGVIILPPTFLYPLCFSELSKGRQREPGFIKKYIFSTLEKLNLKEQAPFTSIKPETMAVHYWRHSWVKSSQEKICDLHNEIKRTQEMMFQEIDLLRQEIEQLRNEVRKNSKEE